MKKLIEAIKNDKELQTLLKEYEILTGKYMLYHYDNFNGIEEYKEDIRKRIEEYKKNNYIRLIQRCFFNGPQFRY